MNGGVMERNGYRLRDTCTRCSGSVTVHRAEIRDHPGRLVRLTCIEASSASPDVSGSISAWQAVPHPALLPVEDVRRSGDTLLLRSPGTTARPLDMLDEGITGLQPTVIARVGERIAGALDTLHRAGHIHGAVGPHTILLGSDGSAWLDGPWHAACLAPDPSCEPAGSVPPTAPQARDEAAQDVQALCTTLVNLLPGSDPGGHDGPRRADAPAEVPPSLRHAEGAQPSSDPAVTALQTLLQAHTGSARELRRSLLDWQPAPPDTSRKPVQTAMVPEPCEPRRPRRSASFVPLALVVAMGALVLAAIVGAQPWSRVIGAADPELTDAPERPAPAAHDDPAAPATSATAAPLEEPQRTGAIGHHDIAATGGRPSVCADAPAPPAPGRLVLADLQDRGCRSPVRIDGGRLAIHADDGTIIEVVLDLEPADQVRLADLDGTGRDEVLVYRPRTGTVFRFPALARPGESVSVAGRASGHIGGTAAVVRLPDGTEHLDIRGGTPA